MTTYEKIKELHRRQAEQYVYLMHKISKIRFFDSFSERWGLHDSCKRKYEQAKKIADGLLDAPYTKNPPSEESYLWYKHTLRFYLAFYELFYERVAVRHDGFLHATPSNYVGSGYPFGIQCWDTSECTKKAEEAVKKPGIVDAEISRYRKFLCDGFAEYGQENLKKSMDKLNTSLPYPL